MTAQTNFKIFGNIPKYHKNNSFSIIISVISYGLILNLVQGERILTSPKLTDWGDWGSWDFCPEGTFVTGMQLYTHPPQGIFRDDRGLTGIRLFCNKFGKQSESQVIKSSVDNVGRWGKTYFCPGIMTGFQFRSEKFRSAFIDDTAGNNMRMFCDYNDMSFKEGDGTGFGKWTDKRLCERHEAVCGIRTQVEKKHSLDQTGVNNVMIKCCDIPHPVHSCVPKTTWTLVTSCDATGAKQDKICSYTRKVGVSYIDAFSDSRPVHEAVGYGLHKMITQFQSKFLNVSSDVSFEVMREDSKDFYWLLSPRYIWEPQVLEMVKVTAGKGRKVVVHQVHGQCGMLQIWGTRLKIVETDPIHNAVTSFKDFTNENEIDYLV